MRQQGKVSLWTGTAKTESEFRSVLRVEFDAKGDFRGSAFSRGFALGRYDDSKREAFRHPDAPHTLDAFLRDVSYEKIVLEGLKAAGAVVGPGDDCYVLLYDFCFGGAVTARWESGGVSLRFVAVSDFESDESTPS
ncbi:MAG: hypothetical protein Q8L14_01245 [Myxococcales bacterium]|nr:hypothetical protein [Myxococcales bacterium]